MTAPIQRNHLILFCLGLLAIASFCLAISLGSVPISVQTIWENIWTSNNHLAQTIIQQLRIPRAINAFTTGALLALSGVLMQALLRNPLADPYILGVSSGSAVATLLGILLGVSSQWLMSYSFFGGLIAMLLVMALSYQRHNWSTLQLLLSGVIFAAGCNAIISLILTLSPDSNLRSMMFWLLGDLYIAPLSKFGLLILLIGLIGTLLIARELDILPWGETKAKSLGLPVRKLQVYIFFLSTLLTSTAVSIAGCIAFIGLVTPHALRLLGCYQHRFLIPGSILAGGSFVCLADCLARTILAPQQLPVGIITALVGVPCFFIILKTSRSLPTI